MPQECIRCWVSARGAKSCSGGQQQLSLVSGVLRHWVRCTALIDVALVCEGLRRIHGYARHVIRLHVRILRNTRPAGLRREVRVRRIFG